MKRALLFVGLGFLGCAADVGTTGPGRGCEGFDESAWDGSVSDNRGPHTGQGPDTGEPAEAGPGDGGGHADGADASDDASGAESGVDAGDDSGGAPADASGDAALDAGGDASGDAALDAGGDASGANACGEGAVTPTFIAEMPDYAGKVAQGGSNVYFLVNDSNAYSIVAVPKAGGPRVTVVPATQTGILSFAVDAGHLYFTTGGSVLKCPLSGCGTSQPAVVASLQVNPRGIVTDGTNVYYTTDSQILVCPVGGCGSSPAVFATFGDGAVELTVGAGALFWTSQRAAAAPSGGVVSSCPLTGCVGAPRVVATTQNHPSAISTDGTGVFWMDGLGHVLACPVTGCGSTPTILANSSFGGPTFSDGRDVYWGGRYRCSVGGCNFMPTRIVDEQLGVIGSDATGLYCLSKTALVKCPPCGCGGAPLAAVRNAPNVEPAVDVIADSSRTFWITDTGLHGCSAANCAATAALESNGAFLSNVISSGDDLYFAVGEPYFGPAGGAVMRCPKAGCSAGATPLFRYSGTPYAVGGNVVGLAPGKGIFLRLGAQGQGQVVTLTANGPFRFPTAVPSGAQYFVSLPIPPNPPECRTQTWTGTTGTVGEGDVTSIMISCDNRVTVGGTLSGWINGPLVLHNGASSVTMHAEGTFAIPATTGATYNVTVGNLPEGETCAVTNGSGNVNGSGDITNVAVNCDFGGGGRQSGLVTDGAYLYWVREPATGNVNGAVLRVPLAGGIPSVLASAQLDTLVSSTAIYGNALYFSAFGQGTISRVPLSGGAVTPVATGLLGPVSLLLNGSTLYFETDDHVESLDLAAAGASPVVVAPNSTGNDLYMINHAAPRRLAVSNGFLYWFDGGVWRSSLTGANPVLLATGSGGEGGLAIVNGRVFFAGLDPTLLSVPQ